MASRLFRRLLVGIALFASLSTWAQFPAMVVFGDSLSDNGNLRASGQFPFLDAEPYNGGRFSDGELAVEVLAQQLGLTLQPAASGGSNFAVAGATAAGSTAIDLTSQVTNYLNATGQNASGEALYVVFIGGNDIRNSGNSPFWQGWRAMATASSAVRRQIQRLIDAGARNLVVVNAPDIGQIPETAQKASASGDRGLARRLSYYSFLYNARLAAELHHLRRTTDARVSPVDLYTWFRRWQRHALELGYANNRDACFVQTGSGAGDIQRHPDCDFERFIFFDALHPTAVTHQRAAGLLQAALPLP